MGLIYLKLNYVKNYNSQITRVPPMVGVVPGEKQPLIQTPV
jgi:hypothetical protein